MKKNQTMVVTSHSLGKLSSSSLAAPFKVEKKDEAKPFLEIAEIQNES
jgi:hypothetical protein